MLPNQKIRVLVVDDDPAMAKFLINHLLRKNFDVSSAATGEEAIRMFRVYDPALVLLDVNTAGMTGIETLERLKQIKPDVAIIMLSAQQDADFIFKASKLGADDYIPKPFEPKDLDQRMARVLERERQVQEVTQLRDQVRRQSDFSMLFGTSPKMEEVKMTVEQVADTNVTVLIRGESGAGKEVVARMVYGNSTRREKPFVKVNCSATSRVHSRAPTDRSSASSSRPTTGPSSSTRSAKCIPRCKPSSCTYCRTVNSRDLAASATFR